MQTDADKDTLFTAYLKVDEYFISKEPIHHNHLIPTLAFVGGLYRSIHFIINVVVVVVAKRMFMLNIMN